MQPDQRQGGSRTASRARASSWLNAYRANSAGRRAAGANSAVRNRSGHADGQTRPTCPSPPHFTVSRITGVRFAPRWRGILSHASLTRSGRAIAGYGTAAPGRGDPDGPPTQSNAAENTPWHSNYPVSPIPRPPWRQRDVRGNARAAPRQAPSSLCDGAERFVEKDPSLQGKSLEDIIKSTHNAADKAPVFKQCRPALEPHRGSGSA